MLPERLQDIERCHEIRNDYVLKIPNGIERTLEILNGMNARPWGHRDQGKGLTASDLVEMTNLPLSEGMGVHAIRPAIKVRKHFPNLYATRNDDTEAQGLPITRSAMQWPMFWRRRRRGGQGIIQGARVHELEVVTEVS